MNQYKLAPTALALALAAALPAYGQSAPTLEKSAESENALPSVVVTATKRSTSATKTPLSLSVVTGDDLKAAGVVNAMELTDQMPNVEIGKGWGNGVEITLRGIGSNDNSERGDPAAAFHLDGVYFGRTRMAGTSFFDVERIEVLRGPQGTLYGRNANAGVVNVITNKPTSKLEGSADLQIGNFGDVRVEGMVNVPVTDMVSLRVAAAHEKNDGYTKMVGFTGGRDDIDTTAGRVQAQIKLSPTTIWMLSADSADIKGHGPAPIAVKPGVATSLTQQQPQVAGSENNTVKGATSDFRMNLGFADLTYILGWKSDSQDEVSSFGDAPSLWYKSSSKFSQTSNEIRLNSPASEPLQWITGVYFFNSTNNDVNFPLYFGSSASQIVRFFQNPAINDSKAVFGQVSYPVAADLRLTAGVRYTEDHKGRKGTTFDSTDTPIGAVGNSADARWEKTTYKLGVEYDATKTSLLFASFATGFKAGGFNDGNNVVGDPNYNPFLYYKPESINSFEVGQKGRYLGGQMEVSNTAFLYDYTDMQVQTSLNNAQATLNAGKSRIYGFESEGRIRITEFDRIDFGLGLLDSKYTKYMTPDGTNYSGKRLDKSPPITFNLGYSRSWNLGNGDSLSAKAGVRYSGAYHILSPGTPAQAPVEVTQNSYTRSNLSLTYWPSSDKWSLQAFVNNIEDKRQINSSLPLGANNFAYYNEPRTFGLRGTARF